MTWNKRSLIWAAAAIIAIIGLIPVTAALAQEEEIELSMAPPQEAQRPPVIFPHEVHMGLYDCLECHHDYQNGENVLDEDSLEEGNPAIQCANCHNGKTSPDLQEAFHRQCIGCHIDVRKSGQPSGPEMCGDCHRAGN
jgi:c(7)-type cytochrome triheme protein